MLRDFRKDVPNQSSIYVSIPTPLEKIGVLRPKHPQKQIFYCDSQTTLQGCGQFYTVRGTRSTRFTILNLLYCR